MTTILRRLLIFSLALLISLAIFGPLQALADPGEENFSSSLGFGLFLAVAVTLFIAPYFYRRALSKKGDKNLSHFLINDPKTRDLLLKKKGRVPDSSPPENSIDPDPPSS